MYRLFCLVAAPALTLGLITTSADQASAAEVNFNDFNSPNSIFQGTSFNAANDDSEMFNLSTAPNGGFLATSGNDAVEFTGSTAAQVLGTSLTLTADGGEDFLFSGFTLAPASNSDDGALDVMGTYDVTLSTGGTLSDTFFVSGSNGFTNTVFNMGTVTASQVVWNFDVDTSSNLGEAQIDDIQVSNVPEPGSLALTGLGALAMLRRRRPS